MSTLKASTTGGSSKTKRTDAQLLSPGHHLCRLYGIVDLGDQLNPMYGEYKPKVVFLFEFPYLLQFYYEEDTVRKPAMVSRKFTLSFHPKANLRSFVDNMLGRKMSDADCEALNIFSLVDKYYVANVIHQESKKTRKTYEAINGISPYDQRFLDNSKELVRHNNTMIYSISEHGFSGEAWRSIYGYLKRDIKESKQGVEFIAGGGTFEDNRDHQQQGSGVQAPPQRQQPQQQAPQQAPQQGGQPQQPFQQNPNNQQAQQGQPQQQQPAQGQPQQQQPGAPPPAAGAGQKPQLVMLSDIPYKSFIDKGWTDQRLVDNGYAKWSIPAAPAASGPPPPPVQQGQQPQAPQQTASNVNSQPQVHQPQASQPPVQNMGNVEGDGDEDDLPF